MTQEVTLSGVQALFRDSVAGFSDCRTSLASSVFEDPTYTMQDAQREVLSLFACEKERWLSTASTHMPLQGAGGTCGTLLAERPDLAAADDDGERPLLSGVCPPLPDSAESSEVCLARDGAQAAPFIEVFEDTEFEVHCGAASRERPRLSGVGPPLLGSAENSEGSLARGGTDTAPFMEVFEETEFEVRCGAASQVCTEAPLGCDEPPHLRRRSSGTLVWTDLSPSVFEFSDDASDDLFDSSPDAVNA